MAIVGIGAAESWTALEPLQWEPLPERERFTLGLLARAPRRAKELSAATLRCIRKRLVPRGLAVSLRRGQYAITPAGRAAYDADVAARDAAYELHSTATRMS